MFLNELRAFFVVHRKIFMVLIGWVASEADFNVSNFKQRLSSGRISLCSLSMK